MAPAAAPAAVAPRGPRGAVRAAAAGRRSATGHGRGPRRRPAAPTRAASSASTKARRSGRGGRGPARRARCILRPAPAHRCPPTSSPPAAHSALRDAACSAWITRVAAARGVTAPELPQLLPAALSSRGSLRPSCFTAPSWGRGYTGPALSKGPAGPSLHSLVLGGSSPACCKPLRSPFGRSASNLPWGLLCLGPSGPHPHPRPLLLLLLPPLAAPTLPTPAPCSSVFLLLRALLPLLSSTTSPWASPGNRTGAVDGRRRVRPPRATVERKEGRRLAAPPGLQTRPVGLTPGTQTIPGGEGAVTSLHPFPGLGCLGPPLCPRDGGGELRSGSPKKTKDAPAKCGWVP